MKSKPTQQAVIYARFSPRRRADECESCDTQIEYAVSYCKFHKLEVLSEHRDDGLSGKSYENRPGIQEAITQAVKHKAVMVVYSLSRLARNVRETIEIVELLHEARANLCSVTEKIDTTTAMGNAFFQIIAVLAELQRKQIGECTAAAMLRHQANGRRMSRRLPFGWQDDPDDPSRMIPEPRELETIERMKELRKDDFSYHSISEKLKEEGFHPRPKMKKVKDKTVAVKGKWYGFSIQRILDRQDLYVF